MKKDQFLKRHQQGPMIRMPNAWDPGSAKLMAAGGAEALGTTSAGIVYAMGRPDYEGKLSSDECLRIVEDICNAVPILVSVDSDDGRAGEHGRPPHFDRGQRHVRNAGAGPQSR